MRQPHGHGTGSPNNQGNTGEIANGHHAGNNDQGCTSGNIVKNMIFQANHFQGHAVSVVNGHSSNRGGSSANLPSTCPKYGDRPIGNSVSSNSYGNPNDLLGNSKNVYKGIEGYGKKNTNFEGKRRSQDEVTEGEQKPGEKTDKN